MTKKDNTEKWLKFLNPKILKDNLIFSSLYIGTFELFKDYIEAEVRSFFDIDYSKEKFTPSDEYKSEVLSKDSYEIKAILLWLKEYGAIEDNDIEIFYELKKYRNKLSHELMELLFEGLPSELPETLIQLIQLREKIEKWWILNVEIPISPDFDLDSEVSEDNIITSSEMIYRIMLDMLSEDEKISYKYMKEMKKNFKGGQ